MAPAASERHFDSELVADYIAENQVLHVRRAEGASGMVEAAGKIADMVAASTLDVEACQGTVALVEDKGNQHKGIQKDKDNQVVVASHSATNVGRGDRNFATAGPMNGRSSAA